MMAQSPTSLQTFNTCPRQYEAKYITKEVQFQPNAHATFGDAVHKAIEAYLKGEDALPTLLYPLQNTLDRMGKVLVGAETKLAVSKEGKSVSFFAKDAYQRCIVDAIIANEDKSIIVCIDWKTGKKRDARVQHDMIKLCTAAAYPTATEIVTHFVYLFNGKSDTQKYDPKKHQLTELAGDMNRLATAYATGDFPPKPSGLCGKWCDVLSCEYNGRR